MPSSTRERIVDAGSELFRRQGYAGTGVKQIVAAASAPFGSLYHFFPEGKEQLGEEVIRTSGAMYGQLLPLFFGDGGDVVRATRRFFDAAAETLRQTDYADACPIATIALEVSSTSEPLRQACADVFNDWLTDLTAIFRAEGLPPKRARDLSVSVLSLLEGAFILGRATRSPEPVRTAGRAAASLVTAARR
jgi:AcrR family transcriptional regulator